MAATRYDPDWVRQCFDVTGDGEWNRLVASPASEVKLHIHRHYLEKHIRPGMRVLEVGAASGRFTQVLAELGARIVVADISPHMIDMNRRYARELGYDAAVEDRLVLDVCDMTALPDAAFDAVVAYGGPLSYVFECHDRALREMLRVLKPAGPLLLSVMCTWGSFHDDMPSVLRVMPAEEIDTLLETGDIHPETSPTNAHRCHMYRAAELRGLLESHGLEVLDMSASNALSIAWGDRLGPARQDPAQWEKLLRMEIQACREPGMLDAGTHLIAVARPGRDAGAPAHPLE